MGPGMIANNMAFVNDALHHFRKFLHVSADQKKGSGHIIFFQYIQYQGGVNPVRPIVKGKSNNIVINVSGTPQVIIQLPYLFTPPVFNGMYYCYLAYLVYFTEPCHSSIPPIRL